MKKLKKPKKLRYQAEGPIITNDPNDPRLRAYQDSLFTYNYTKKNLKGAKDFTPITEEQRLEINQKYNSDPTINLYKGILPISSYYSPSLNQLLANHKKPVQPVAYQPKQKNITLGKAPINEGKKLSNKSTQEERAKFFGYNTQPKTREAIPVQGYEQRPYDSIMMPSGQRVTKEQFIKQYGMDVWNKKYGKRLQDGGIARDNTQVSSTPIGSLKAWNKYPHTPSPKEAGNTFLNEVVNPFLSFGLASGTLGGGVRTGPELFEGQKAVDYLNSQRAWRPGNPIGTLRDTKVNQQVSRYMKTPFMTNKTLPETGGSTTIPGTKRATQMQLNKQYGVDPTIEGTSTNTLQKLYDQVPYDIEQGFVPKGAAYAEDLNSSWNWHSLPHPLQGKVPIPKEEFSLNYVGSNQMGGPIVHPMGQLKYPGQVTQIPSNNISMAGVNYPVLGISDTGHSKMMQPGASYKFQGTSVTEYPLLAGKMAVNKGMMRKGGGKWTGPRPWNVKVDRNDSGGLKYGGSSDDCFPDEISFPQQKKNDFLKFLRDTSFDKVQQELNSDITDFHNKTMDEFKKGGFKLNPKHKGFCSPMTKSTCTGKRRQFAINAKNHFKKQQMGGVPNPMAAQAFQSQQTAYQPWWDYIPNASGALPDMINAGMEGATSFINNLPGGAQDRLKKWQKKTTTADWWNPLQQGSRGDYTTNYGYFRPDQHTGVQFPGAQGFQQYKEGGEYEADEQEIQKLIDQGYKISYI